MLLIGVFTLYLTKNTQFFKVAVYRAARHRSNTRLTCISVFAEACSEAKLARKLHKRGAARAATAQATFVTKQMSALKRVLDTLFYLYLLLDTYTLHYFSSYYYPSINEKTDSLSITRLKHQNTTFIFLNK